MRFDDRITVASYLAVLERKANLEFLQQIRLTYIRQYTAEVSRRIRLDSSHQNSGCSDIHFVP
jgi:hypothetical protein